MGYDSSLARFDGGFLCCICFERVENKDAWRDPDGQAWDMCQSCGEREGRP